MEGGDKIEETRQADERMLSRLAGTSDSGVGGWESTGVDSRDRDVSHQGEQREAVYYISRYRVVEPVRPREHDEIRNPGAPEQVWLMEQLAHLIRANTLRQQQMLENQIAAMASDPDIRREIDAIQAEFAGTESDGLADA